MSETPDSPADPGDWIDVGAAGELAAKPVQPITVNNRRLALSFKDGLFGAVDNACNHAGGPLAEGALIDDFISCPWHHWKFHRLDGRGEPGYEQDRVPSHAVRIENGRVLVSAKAVTRRDRLPHAPHPLARAPKRAPGPPRVVGISTTVMDNRFPRYSTSEALLEAALDHAKQSGHEVQSIRLRELNFRACEGYYSKSAHACTWPCSITQIHKNDELDRVYEALVHWGDVFLIATPIRWGGASSLYYKMIERMNCIQNQITLSGKVLLSNKVVGAIITGGQDNVQAVAGQILGFFAELGCHFPPFPYIAHSRGWDAEDMERNVQIVQASESLRQAAGEMTDRCIELAQRLLDTAPQAVERAGRKGQRLTGR